MQTLIFDTKIFQNGIIKIPELSTWQDNEVKIIVIKKQEKISIKKYNIKKILEEFDRVRQIKTSKAEKLTLNKAINIYDELTNIS